MTAFVRRPVPPVTSETRQWWDATRQRRLTVQRCEDCGHHQLYPRLLCTGCGSTRVRLVDAAGTGSVYSFTVVHRSPDPDAFVPPYAVALVRLDEGPVLTTNLMTDDLDALRCDQRVSVVWEALPDGRHLPLFHPDDEAGT